MEQKYIDLTNQKFGRLTVLHKGNGRHTSGGHYKTTWVCQCECGNTIEVDSQKLRKGHTMSCGCLIKENKGHAFEDLTGQRFNRLTVIKFIPQSERTTRHYNWLCQCDCGNICDANTDKLKKGLQQSCGCLKEEMKYNIKDVNRKYKHTDKRLYGVYKAMLDRCCNPESREYHNYGGRGITVCNDWIGDLAFDAFAEWAYSSGYNENAKRGECTLDRIDVDKGYSPDNCRWITNKQQQNNRRDCHYYEYDGKKQTIAEWAETLNVPYNTLWNKLTKNKWSIEDFLKHSTQNK